MKWCFVWPFWYSSTLGYGSSLHSLLDSHLIVYARKALLEVCNRGAPRDVDVCCACNQAQVWVCVCHLQTTTCMYVCIGMLTPLIDVRMSHTLPSCSFKNCSLSNLCCLHLTVSSSSSSLSSLSLSSSRLLSSASSTLSRFFHL